MNSDLRQNLHLHRLAWPVALAMLLGACTDHSTAVGRIDPADFGEANRQTYAAMIIDPDPVYDSEMTTSAEHSAEAVERYRMDRVKQPERVSSTSVGSGSGGSSSGGSSPN